MVSAQDVARPKPHPESFERILSHFGLTPREAIYIGDSAVDQAFAANAGVPLVAYRNPRLQGGSITWSLLPPARICSGNSTAATPH